MPRVCIFLKVRIWIHLDPVILNTDPLPGVASPEILNTHLHALMELTFLCLVIWKCFALSLQMHLIKSWTLKIIILQFQHYYFFHSPYKYCLWSLFSIARFSFNMFMNQFCSNSHLDFQGWKALWIKVCTWLKMRIYLVLPCFRICIGGDQKLSILEIAISYWVSQKFLHIFFTNAVHTTCKDFWLTQYAPNILNSHHLIFLQNVPEVLSNFITWKCTRLFGHPVSKLWQY